MQPRPGEHSEGMRHHLHNRHERHPSDTSAQTVHWTSDEALFAAVKQGDVEAFGMLYDRYAAKVYRVARRLIPDPHVIQEIIQDVFTRIWSTRSFDASLGEFDHWIAVVTRRIAIDHIRRQSRVLPHWSHDDATMAASDNLDRIVSGKLLRHDLIRAMSELAVEQRTVLELAYCLGEFTVDHDGYGALSVKLSGMEKYDALVVTLEPHWGDREPEGPQVLSGPWLRT